MFYAFFPCNHNPATSIADSLANGTSIEQGRLYDEIDSKTLNCLENFFYIPKQFHGNGIMFSTASEGFMNSCIQAKLRKQTFGT